LENPNPSPEMIKQLIILIDIVRMQFRISSKFAEQLESVLALMEKKESVTRKFKALLEKWRNFNGDIFT